MRCRADTGHLAPARIASLNAIDPFWNPLWSLRWQYTYAQIRRRLTTSTWRCTYHRHDSRDSAWDSWLDRQITHSHLLDPQQKHLLAALARACPDAHPHSMLLTRPTSLRERAFNRGLRAARQYHQRHGHLDMPQDHTEEILGDQVHLGAWLIRRRRDSAQMTPRQQAGLEALGFQTMPVFLPPAQPLRDAAA
ncbi:helicase associated domain-containing protein [Streptomyces sp. NPDC006385]|uniref:helicase associated domain-containing protein n=1 Tax=Streptomyces sp. NPDC006385 TaxID=3156761 RepID=UPI0033B0886A